MKVNAAPFALGKTYYEGEPIDQNNLQGGHLLGIECEFLDVDAGKLRILTGRPIKTILVRNVSGQTLLPKRLVRWGDRLKTVDGYTSTDFEEIAGVVDPFLPESGVPNGDIFHLVVSGPVLVKSSTTALPKNVAVGDVLYALTAASSLSNAAGRFTVWGGTFSLAQTTDGTIAKLAMNRLGRAMSARTTGQTDTDTLVDVRLL